MKTLILLRHGKSEDINPFKKDFERHLMPKGINDLEQIAKFFAALHIKIEHVLCSSANRTKETFSAFQSHLNEELPVVFLKEIYHASASELLEILQEEQEKYETILLVGHNFGISQLAYYLSESGCLELPTSGLVILQFPETIQYGEGKLIQFISPKTI